MEAASPREGRVLIDNETRRLLIRLARSSRSRTADFRRDRPTYWCPSEVRNPAGILDTHFTDSTAWELIAARLDQGEPVEVIDLRRPPGNRGYVMKIDLGRDVPGCT